MAFPEGEGIPIVLPFLLDEEEGLEGVLIEGGCGLPLSEVQEESEALLRGG